MKMINYRLFLLAFVTASFFLLTGFEKSDADNVPLTETQTASVNVKKVQFSTSKSKHKKTKHKQSVPNANEAAELQKSLDLTIPFKDSGNAWQKTEQNRVSQVEPSNMFAIEKKKKRRPVDLNGQMLMSQEPEVDKQKSLDGAGIVINLKR